MRVLWSIIWILLINIIEITSVSSAQTNSCGTILPPLPTDTDHKHKDSVRVSASLQSNCQIYNRLELILKELGIFSAESDFCITLETLTRIVFPSDNSSSQRRISVSLDLIVSSQPSGKDQNTTVSNNCHNMGTYSRRVEAMEQLQSQNNQSEAHNVSTAVDPPSKHAQGEDSGGLSYTQMVVIATCASIIGTFFLIAGIIRARNYWKRWQEEQAASRRLATTNYRLPLHSSNQEVHGSPKDSRAGSSGSGHSQNSPMLKHNDLYNQVGNGKSVASPNKYLDTMPLLVVTAPSTGPNTPLGSVSSIQYIDEEPDTKEEDLSNNEKNSEDGECAEKSDSYTTSGTNQRAPNQNMAQVDQPIRCIVSEQNKSNSLITDNCEIQGHADSHFCPDGGTTKTDINPTQNHLEETPNNSLINCGISQSDESLGTTANHAYCYGNQSEYLSSSGYGNFAYYCNELEDNISENTNNENQENESEDIEIEEPSPNISSLKDVGSEKFTSLFNDCNDETETGFQFSQAADIPEETVKAHSCVSNENLPVVS
ncbi:uncharacterized protein LOC133205916 [Saccostrea echinata]|uniref:uncharacterized protein LOC133205916 n=1 Tax=Saccostrea echinata TaxID=191078 RepID=UPI002A7ECD90|nr:uncharacterized protein LOC133205916 [Saccostrea echinata]